MNVQLWAAVSAAVLATSCASASDGDRPTGAEPSSGAATGTVAASRSSSTIDVRRLARFEPNPSSTKTVNYDAIDDALDLVVFNAGPSLRRREPRPEPLVGSRFVKGHVSPYRLEGNKIFFSQFNADVVETLSSYRSSLERIGASGCVQTLPRNEQLAFWFNLHNIVVIDEISKAYPVSRPSRLQPNRGDERLDEAKIVDLGDVSLSLREIRQIVYTNWNDPRVIYGFFRGDIGGPSVRSATYRGADVSVDLDRQAAEFVNSLRGVQSVRDDLLVSPIYDEARATYFPNWPSDLVTHLTAHAGEEVADAIMAADGVRLAVYEDRIADLAGGNLTSDLGFGGSFAPLESRASLEENGVERNFARFPQSMNRMVREYENKFLELRAQGYFDTRVIVVDIPTDDEASKDVE